jgi:hypothetical protein
MHNFLQEVGGQCRDRIDFRFHQKPFCYKKGFLMGLLLFLLAPFVLGIIAGMILPSHNSKKGSITLPFCLDEAIYTESITEMGAASSEKLTETLGPTFQLIPKLELSRQERSMDSRHS